MKLSLRSVTQILAVGIISVISGIPFSAAQTSQFSEQEIDQTKFILIAAPIGSGGAHQLIILEQISDDQQCWHESGNNPVVVEPLLLNFDFTGLCGRSADSNGYSIRRAEEDLGTRYLLKIRKTDADMVLMGVPDFKANGDPDIELGRTNGVTNGFAKIMLKPDWQLTKRSFKEKTLGHIYISK